MNNPNDEPRTRNKAWYCKSCDSKLESVELPDGTPFAWACPQCVLGRKANAIADEAMKQRGK